jgi:hypothetical protein
MLKDMKEVDYIKEYLKVNNYKSTLECLEKEERYLQTERNSSCQKNKMNTPPKSYLSQLINSFKEKTKKISLVQEAYINLDKKRQALLQFSRQMYSIMISYIKDFQDIKNVLDIQELTEENRKKVEEYNTKVNYYKLQIGKYNQILLDDEWNTKSELINKEIILEHKNNLNTAKNDKNNIRIMEILLSLRLYALQTIPEQRKNLIEELIKNDILYITEPKNNFFINELLNIHSYQIRHSILSIISIISSIYEGVNYLLTNNYSILEKIIEIMKGTEDGQVLQRFGLAILTKMSLNENTAQIFIKYGVVDFIIKLLQRSRINKINQFCLDFSTALLANILRTKDIKEFLINNASSVYRNLLETFLTLIEEDISIVMLKNILISLGYLISIEYDGFKNINDECRFKTRIDSFFDKFTQNKTKNEAEEVEKHNIIDLCRLLLPIHGEYKKKFLTEKKRNYEDIIKEFENKNGNITFEYFRDEIC